MAKPRAVQVQRVALTLNGKARQVEAAPMKRLLDVLREDFDLTGVKEGCGEGECGACTVLLDGLPALACMVPICQAQGAEVTTVEGLAKGPALHPVQRAFVEEGGAQCGICTPGMVVAAAYYLDHPEAAADVREALAGNQCRCTGYTRIFAAVERAFELAGKRPPGDGDVER